MPNGESAALAKTAPGQILTPTDLMVRPSHALTELLARFPEDLKNPAAARQFYGVCLALDLNPFLDEITVYQGRPYVEAAGWEKKIAQKAPGQLVKCAAMMATPEERLAFGIPEGDLLAKCVVVRKFPNGTMSEHTAYATVTKKEATPKEGKGAFRPIEKEPWYMAMKRARVRALRISFRDTLTSGQDSAISDDGVVQVDQLSLPAVFDGEDLADGVPVRDIEDDAQDLEPEPLPVQATIEHNLKQAAAAARGGFYVRARELGLTHSGVHKTLRLACDGKHEDEPDYDEGPPCKALSKQIAAWVQAGDSEAGAWVRMRERLETFLGGR